MKTIYIYLAWTGWIWFLIFGSYLFMKLRSRSTGTGPQGFEVVTKAEQSNEQ